MARQRSIQIAVDFSFTRGTKYSGAEDELLEAIRDVLEERSFKVQRVEIL